MTDHRSADPRAVHSAVQFLMALHFINWIGFAGWNALLHNYTIEAAGFGWFEAGLTQTVREIPGFLAFTVAFWLMIVREQVLQLAALRPLTRAEMKSIAREVARQSAFTGLAITMASSPR